MPETDKLKDLAKKVKAWGLELGFQQVAISEPDLSSASKNLLDWLDKGYQGSMQWMGEHGEKRYTPNQLVENSLRVISVRMDYLTDSNMIAVLKDDNKAYISRYALGRDYHKLIRKAPGEIRQKNRNRNRFSRTQPSAVNPATLCGQCPSDGKTHRRTGWARLDR